MATVNTAGTPQRGLLLTPAQVANLPSDQQGLYMANLSPSEQALVHQEAKNAKVAMNRAFMRQSIERIAYCPVSGGSGVTATFVPGTTLYFDLPVVGGGYAKALLVTYNLTVTEATGTSAAYVPSVAAPFNLFQELQVVYNGAQCRMHPYVLKVVEEVQGYAKYIPQNGIPAGFNRVTAIDNQIGFIGGAGFIQDVPQVTTAVGANTWQGKILLRLNAIGEDTVPGVLPVMGVGNKPQIKLTCAASMLGNDPLLNPTTASGGTAGWATTVSGTVNVDMVYLDGTSMSNPSGIALDITQEPTLQYYWDTPLNPLSANLLMRQHIATLLEHWYVISVVIDGNNNIVGPDNYPGSRNHFAQISNLQQLQLSADSVGQQNFFNFNVSNNVSIYDYYDRLIRRVHGVDLDPGVVLWVDAPARGVLDPDNRNGIQALNMQPGGYPAATHAYFVGSTGGATSATYVAGAPFAVPRVETFLISMNYAGLKLS